MSKSTLVFIIVALIMVAPSIYRVATSDSGTEIRTGSWVHSSGDTCYPLVDEPWFSDCDGPMGGYSVPTPE